ncbi:putative glycosyltransferase [Agrobacterium rubi TR3 = NBRC 13261]|uniref:Putative glycosyltransferase n=1 Tax=Agrobacterium rubi TR3 = NBRC 13261 TaxID=1368415 RepID=A0A081CYE0_9HYPH|nr:glycosyltransferase [Agrobacterium rubi]MBP1879909.1 UDP:flavonoid glycosyltransferase YjiC (YdhE family) [Agrobacterium rubi]MCL6654009.1 glucosyl transferase [Agrobacterium rubi]GAK71686.1 putative glycosyltransferase [Agrobacterium rubi TR3 = NBRC 13261]
MRIVIFTIGTEGDVRPLVALGAGLKRAGHDVRIASDPSCASLITAQGLEFAPLAGDFLDWMQKNEGLQRRGLGTFAMVKAFQNKLRDIAAVWPQQGLAAADGAGLLIGNGIVYLLAEALGQKLHLPVVETQLVPTLPSHNPPLMPLPNWAYDLPPAVNHLLGQFMRKTVWRVYRPAYNEVVRPNLGLPPYARRGPYHGPQTKRLSLFGFSPTMVEPGRNWPDTVKVTGPWSLEEAQTFKPSAELSAFLEAGPPPVYVGFGSMFNHDAEAFTALVRGAVKTSGKRLLLASGWGGLHHQAEASDDIMTIDRAPHDWLFPRMALAVHHGGAGTTNAACRAGIPSVVIPVFGDQPFWASRLRKLGVAGHTPPREALTAEALSNAILEADSPARHQAAQALGEKLRAENGVANAISALEQAMLL